MELQVLLWILAGGFTGTWGLCIFFMSRADNTMSQMKNDVARDISEIRKEISELYFCVKDHHGRLCILEEQNKEKK